MRFPSVGSTVRGDQELEQVWPFEVTPGDARYPALCTGMNQRWTASPEKIFLPASTEEVVQAVQFAVSGGKRITVRSGGHCYRDFVSNAQTQIICDMSELSGISYNRELRAIEVGAGCRLLDVYETLHRRWDVTIPGGHCPTVGVGGHIAGGGFGLLSRRYGLTVDHLQAVEVVVVDAYGTAKSVVATREDSDPNRELWWAHTGGGGGNFGIVTRYWFRSPGAT
ncbi:FAD-binding oxidoreductase, partial [Nocardia aurea]|uniref:FAD-binding oxidoreductase n=1 Tax=Nocardia aurea TaxID=2144174 RepID=UPI001300A7EC